MNIFTFMTKLENQQSAPESASSSFAAPFKRKDERKQAFLAADLVLSERYAPVACLVTDTSTEGFRLHIETPHRLPPQVTLIISHPRRTYACEVVWRNQNEVGLKIDARKATCLSESKPS